MDQPETPSPKPAEKTPSELLAAYRAKRSTDRTPEPFGGDVVPSTGGGLFVVHKHDATRLHYDLRLEMDGVLKSWAVPKGPSPDLAEKRLAVRVEDHPLEYGDFEGIIPAGNYGAGAVIVWDRGEWLPLEDPKAGLEKGKLAFELKGYKLRGRWALVKLKKAEKEWLLIKERDAWVTSGTSYPEGSVLSGLTVEDLTAGHTPADLARSLLEKLDVPKRVVDPAQVAVMLAEPRDEAFSKEGWIFELKLDGYRLIAVKSMGQAQLITRNGLDYTAVFPEVARAVLALPYEHLILDGEVVVPDPSGKPSFALLQKRGGLTRPTDVRRAAVRLPANYFAFDLLGFESFDPRPAPLIERKKILRQLLPPVGVIRYLDHVERDGVRFLEQVGKMGLEGIIGKKADAPYRAGRSPVWLKFKVDSTGDFVVVGFTEPRGNRQSIGSLHLADWVNGRLVYAGRAGTGLNDRQLREFRKILEPRARATAPCEGPVVAPGEEPRPIEVIPDQKSTTWVEPHMVVEVRFREWTPDGYLRHPAFLRVREDKRVEDCDRQGWNVPGSEAPRNEPSPADAPPPPPNAEGEPRKISLSNLTKIFWPEEGYTKGDLIEYYRTIAPWILPYLKGRPVVMTRYPDGIHGKSFYQKDAPEFAPDWIPTVAVWSEDTERDIRYFVCNDQDTLVYLANLGTIPLHIWASRVGSLELPDWCVIDLDPKDAPFSEVIAIANTLHRICDEAELPNYVKTTGKTGLHVMVPLGRQFTYEQSRTLGELLARLVIRHHAKTATIVRSVTKRGDKVYLDYLQNRHGQLIVAPFSVRPLPGATVSMPLVWDEVNDDLDPRRFTIENALERMTTLGEDPVRPVIDQRLDLAQVLARLASIQG